MIAVYRSSSIHIINSTARNPCGACKIIHSSSGAARMNVTVIVLIVRYLLHLLGCRVPPFLLGFRIYPFLVLEFTVFFCFRVYLFLVTE